MEPHRPLFWHQGLFLQPHHFQQLELALRSQWDVLRRYLKPCCWGVVDVEIEKAALKNRSFTITTGEFLFPDGTYVAFPGTGLLSPRSFDSDWVEGGRPMTVYVGIKKWSETSENVTVVPDLDQRDGVLTRFVAPRKADSVPDLHQDGPVGDVQRLYYLLRVFWDTEVDLLGDYLLLPVARLERFGDEIRCSEQFAAPSLRLRADPVLNRLVQEIRDEIGARCHKLESYKAQRGVHTAEFGARDMVYLLALRSLNRYFPVLCQLCEVDEVHPLEVYTVLRQVVGELSSFSDSIDVLGYASDGEARLPAYDHEDLWRCFSSARRLVTELLDQITAGPEYVIPLLFDGTYFSADLDPAVFEGRNRYYLVLRTEEDPAAVLNSVRAVTKLCSREFLPILIARALPGIDLEHLPVPPQELPRRAQCLYFQVNHHGDLWSHVEQNRNLALYWDEAPKDLEAQIMIVARG